MRDVTYSMQEIQQIKRQLIKRKFVTKKTCGTTTSIKKARSYERALSF